MNAGEIRLYVQPGCTSCLKAKEFLSKNLEGFEIIDITQNTAALDELLKRGIRSVPVVTVGDRHCFGNNVRDLATFLGIDFQQPLLTFDQLADKYLRVLDVATALVNQIPTPMLAERPTVGRERTVGYVALHIFDIAERFLASYKSGSFRRGRDHPVDPSSFPTGAHIAEHGRLVREGMREWSKVESGKAELGRPIETWHGAQTLHRLFERCVWHSAQHTRQIHMMLEARGLTTEARLTEADLEGLPVPEKVHD
jgi:glutaredoxin